jgi:hypothetical protein
MEQLDRAEWARAAGHRAEVPTVENGMRCLGIELHRRRSHIAVVDEGGSQVLSRRIDNDPSTFLELLAEVGDASKVALEATYGWGWLAELLEGAGYELTWRTCCAPRRSPPRG